MALSLRGGSFSGTLDPFGGGRGGLGRYDVGSGTTNLAEYEAYAVYVAWLAGDATDDEYLASLATLIGLAPENSREKVSAQKRYDDAKYSIDHNALVRDVNNATTDGAKRRALEKLLTFEQARLATMEEPGSEAYREQLDRISTIRGDLRQQRYGALLERVNRGTASTGELRALARTLAAEARADGDPDVDDWQDAVGALTERMREERLADIYQDYQFGRVDGDVLLAALDAQLAGLDPKSAKYRELARAREDFVERWSEEQAAMKEAEIQGLRNDGKITDSEYLNYLANVYENADPGSVEFIHAGNRLRDATFSLAEDQLRADVTLGKRPIGDLIKFYENALVGMVPGSERYRQIKLAINSLRNRGGGGGGGGGSITLGPKLLSGVTAMEDILADPKNAPPGFAGLFQIDPTNPTSWTWFSRNHDSMNQAFQRGAGEWTYYAPDGSAYRLAFDPTMMTQFDALHMDYARIGIILADGVDDAQKWVGRLISATGQAQSHGAEFTMNSFTDQWQALERAKAQAFAGGRFAEYQRLSELQFATAAYVLGNEDADTSLAHPFLTRAQLDTIEGMLQGIAPYNGDPTAAGPNGEKGGGFFPGGDKVLAAIKAGIIQIEGDQSVIDPNRAFVTQAQNGVLELVLTDPQDTVLNELDGSLMPGYQMNHTPVKIRRDGQDVVVWQPVAGPGFGAGTTSSLTLPVVVIDNVVTGGGSAFGTGGRQGGPSPTTTSYRNITSVSPQTGVAGRASLPVYTIWTVDTNGDLVQWVSLRPPDSGGQPTEWLRLGPEQNELGAPPRIVVPDGVTFENGTWKIDGKDATDAEVLERSRWWTGTDSIESGEGLRPMTEAPKDKHGLYYTEYGTAALTYVVRKAGQGEAVADLRSDYIIDSEERASLFLRTLHRGGAPRTLDPRATEVRKQQELAIRRAGVATDNRRRAGAPLALRSGVLPKSLRDFSRPRVYGPSPIEIERRDLALPPRPVLAVDRPDTPTLNDLADLDIPDLAPLPGYAAPPTTGSPGRPPTDDDDDGGSGGGGGRPHLVL